ncbi:MAG TPA: CUAEP/CCAEP-tail radical SAM protein, partial [Candidatus Polarisedimenticolia bacterium]|nr:CUAEP/CCAEP-tail radical SAM protein [Candidatus Polarisedimenticolia bacterium]
MSSSSRSTTSASLRNPGAVLLLSCYELGRQPLSLASPLALLVESGFFPAAIDLAVERLDPDAVATARFIAIAVPMHTALRLGVKAAARIRSLNPSCHLCFYGLYATLNAGTLLAGGADSIIGGEYEEPLLRLVERLERDTPAGTVAERKAPRIVPGVRTRQHPEEPWLKRIRFAVPRRGTLPPLERYARLEHAGASRLAGQVEASRGCLHHCRHCP